MNIFKRKTADELKKYLEEKEKIRQTRVRYKEEKKEHKQNEKNIRNENENNHRMAKIKRKKDFISERNIILDKSHNFKWYNFFTKWFFIGIIIMFISVCITFISNAYLLPENEIGKAVMALTASLLSTVGAALFVACVFDFSKNSEAFVAFISKILSDIIVSKTFLSSLAATDKKDALKLILQPSDKQIEQYSNINEYFKKKLDDYMRMFDTNFKTNLTLNIEAKREGDKVICESVLFYTVYKIRDEFEPIRLVFEKEGSRSEDIIIIYEGGKEELDKNKIKENRDEQTGLTSIVFEIPDSLKEYDHLTIKRKMIEPGHDHWISYNWQSLTPYENLSCNVKCFDNLTIKEFMIFDNKAYYHSELSSDNKSLNITSSQWLESDTGFYVIISDT